MERNKRTASSTTENSQIGIPPDDGLDPVMPQYMMQTTAHDFQMQMSMSMMMKRKHTVLVIDDDPQVCRLMERCLSEHFDEVITTTDPIRAHSILEQRRVTHILTDLFLGASADGLSFVALWKREFSCIERAVLFTAGDIQAIHELQRLPPEIDAVISKLEGIDSIIAALCGGFR